MCAKGVAVLYRGRKPRADYWTAFGRIGSTPVQRVRIDSMLVRISYRDISVEYKFTNRGDLLKRLMRPGYNSFSLPLSNSWPCFETKDGNVLANTA